MSDDPPRVIRFPQSRVPGRSRSRPVKELGVTPLARQIDPTDRGLRGHWCSRCWGVWYGRAGEVECPVCGNRHG
ncbi:hypothetical protein SAMN06265365_13730 [Tistlia consotensis]|uniref:Uncharacterized protein n=1 Tax=Tistlia consotensis USBA 355 TaxID=560819 RepID=A0A1Y6BXW4_9PROT|nr:hypothetical protein [Tistlia consotensis]SMF30881.1 hypothetical protein SAMN05428998_110133 [Tistlia consotensis USBA 355]SNS19612.1 hypothetical protein SAMN06265365_13730 [Tistlia consotensis]